MTLTVWVSLCLALIGLLGLFGGILFAELYRRVRWLEDRNAAKATPVRVFVAPPSSRPSPSWKAALPGHETTVFRRD